jgi:hypothetical protein
MVERSVSIGLWLRGPTISHDVIDIWPDVDGEDVGAEDVRHDVSDTDIGHGHRDVLVNGARLGRGGGAG